MTQIPFPMPGPEWLQTLLRAAPEPPQWLQAELQNRCVLWMNHVLMQEPQAIDRLRRQQGKVVWAHWTRFDMGLQITPAGLLAVAGDGARPDLRLEVLESSPWAMAQAVLNGGKPPVDIQGDVQLAADVAWLFDNVRWDVEEDLSRILGDVWAHRVVEALDGLREAVKTFAARASAMMARPSGQPGEPA